MGLNKFWAGFVLILCFAVPYAVWGRVVVIVHHHHHRPNLNQ